MSPQLIRVRAIELARQAMDFDNSDPDVELRAALRIESFVKFSRCDADLALKAVSHGTYYGRTMTVVLAIASSYLRYFTTGEVGPSREKLFVEVPELKDGSFTPVGERAAGVGPEGGDQGSHGLSAESGLDSGSGGIDGGIDGGDEFGIVGHEESSVYAFGSAATVGEAARIGNDPAGRGAV